LEETSAARAYNEKKERTRVVWLMWREKKVKQVEEEVFQGLREKNETDVNAEQRKAVPRKFSVIGGEKKLSAR